MRPRGRPCASAARPLAAVALALACGSACARPRAVALDLVSSFSEAELRSDALDLPLLAADPDFERRGFSALERSGGSRLAWAVGGASRLRLPFRSASDKELDLAARSHESLGPTLPLDVSLNDQPLGTLTLTPHEQLFRVVLPAAAQVRGDNVLKIVSPRRREPSSVDPDKRMLVAAFSVLGVRPLGARARPALPAREGASLLIPPWSSIGYYLRVPGSARLEVESSGSRLEAVLEDDAARSPLTFSGTSADLGDHAGRIVRLELANAGGEALRVRAARITVPPPPATPPRRAAISPPPHIIFFLVDTLRADVLGAYGYTAPTSPRLDRFQEEAIVFEDCWAQASWTRSAVASIFTGLHVGTHGVDREDRVLAPGANTLAERLRAAGYRTGAFVANHLLGGRFGFGQGFETWNDGDDHLYGAPAFVLVDRALRWLDGARAPAFLYVHTMEPHSPYTPSPEDWRPFAPAEYRGSEDTRALLRLGQLGRLRETELQFLRSRYLGEVHQNDRAFGALLDGLRARGLLDKSLVVFTADHGEELLEHKGTEHAKTLYQELLRVPLLVRLPGARRGGARETETVEQIDLLPTLLSLAGVGPRGGLPGRDLSPRWLDGGAPDPAPPLLFSEERFEVVDKYAVRAGATKLILNNDGPELWRAGVHLELYDLARDPGEKENLVSSRPVTLAFLTQQVAAFRKAQTPAAAARVVLSPKEEEELRALGYVR